MICFPALLALVVMPALSLGVPQQRVALAALRHDYRPLLVFAAADNEEVREQVKLLADHAQEMRERQVVLVPVLFKGEGDMGGLPEVWLEHVEEAAARRRFHVGPEEFAVILLGKDGGEKLRSQNPVTMERLNKLIDGMPMRQKEARDGHSG
ncbi:MAG: DUF4174 domain-containing protein [Acidobacteriota bacterium]|nr:DUF4174 domain-containing protein [Acidobacteriota bacterium]